MIVARLFRLAGRSPRQSVESYIHNLNTNPAYRELRAMRASQRKSNQRLTGSGIALGLVNYSARGEAYIEELQAMIRVNGLGQFDTI